MRVCPVISDFSYTNEQRKSKPYVAWANQDELRNRSTSGGVFAAIASYVLNHGGVVAGVNMEHSVARHIMIENVNDLHKLQGSKYQQSDTSRIYRSVQEHLEKNKTVLFSGTGCQVGALYSFLGKRTFDNLFTIDLVCSGVPSRLLINKYVEQIPNSEIISYRDKTDGWNIINVTTIENGQTKRNSPYATFIKKSFLTGFTSRYACNNCLFTGLHRQADLTLADFWGDKDYPAEHQKGISFMTIHSDKGAWLAQNADLSYHLSTWSKSITKNPRMVTGKTHFISHTLERIYIGKLFNTCSFSFLSGIYAGKYTGILWFPYKVYRFIIWKWNALLVKKKVKKILSREEQI